MWDLGYNGVIFTDNASLETDRAVSEEPFIKVVDYRYGTSLLEDASPLVFQ
jgi:hypothetical protein